MTPRTTLPVPSQLFDPGTTQPPKCRAQGCPSVKNLCLYDGDVAHGIRGPWSPRPKTCLNAYDPAKAEIPY